MNKIREEDLFNLYSYHMKKRYEKRGNDLSIR